MSIFLSCQQLHCTCVVALLTQMHRLHHLFASYININDKIIILIYYSLDFAVYKNVPVAMLYTHTGWMACVPGHQQTQQHHP